MPGAVRLGARDLLLEDRGDERLHHRARPQDADAGAPSGQARDARVRGSARASVPGSEQPQGRAAVRTPPPDPSRRPGAAVRRGSRRPSPRRPAVRVAHQARSRASRIVRSPLPRTSGPSEPTRSSGPSRSMSTWHRDGARRESVTSADMRSRRCAHATKPRDDGTVPDDVRRPRVVANVALIAMFAAVAVPGPVGSWVPSPNRTPSVDLSATSRDGRVLSVGRCRRPCPWIHAPAPRVPWINARDCYEPTPRTSRPRLGRRLPSPRLSPAVVAQAALAPRSQRVLVRPRVSTASAPPAV